VTGPACPGLVVAGPTGNMPLNRTRNRSVFMTGFFLTLLFALCLAGGLFWLWVRHTDAQLDDASQAEWDAFQKHEPDFVAHMNQAEFHRVFRRTHFPRFPVYAALIVTTFILLLPVTFAILVFGTWVGETTGIFPEAVSVTNMFFTDVDLEKREAALQYAEDLSGFYYFFGVLGVWLLTAGLFLRHYHKNRPGYLRDEIIRTR